MYKTLHFDKFVKQRYVNIRAYPFELNYTIGILSIRLFREAYQKSLFEKYNTLVPILNS